MFHTSFFYKSFYQSIQDASKTDKISFEVIDVVNAKAWRKIMPASICHDQECNAKKEGTQFIILLTNHADDSSHNTDKRKGTISAIQNRTD